MKHFSRLCLCLGFAALLLPSTTHAARRTTHSARRVRAVRALHAAARTTARKAVRAPRVAHVNISTSLQAARRMRVAHINLSSPLAPWGAVAPGQQLNVRTTAYSPNEPGSNRSAVDSRLSYGGKIYSAAADWSWLPLGTVFRMKETGRLYRIEDYGSALVGRKTIDLYMPTDRLMNSWGVRQVGIEILEMGSFEKSLAVLKSRTGNRHVRKMVASLRDQQNQQVFIAATRLLLN